MTTLPVSVADIDNVLRVLARHQADAANRGDLAAAVRDQWRIDAYLAERSRVALSVRFNQLIAQGGINV